MQARCGTLREYQQQLIDRFRGTVGSDACSSHLGFKAGEWTWVVPLTDISEVVPVPSLVSVPHTADWFVGVANVRGSLYAVTDFARFLDATRTPTTHTQDTRLVLLHARYRMHAALLISRNLGLRQMKTRAQYIQGNPSWGSVAYAESDGCIWRELNILALTRSARFLQISARAVEPYVGAQGLANTTPEK